jgi:hypothetical protein
MRRFNLEVISFALIAKRCLVRLRTWTTSSSRAGSGWDLKRFWMQLICYPSFERFITMKKLLILLISFTFICTAKATNIDDVIIKGLPVKMLSSGKSYKVFEQYP